MRLFLNAARNTSTTRFCYQMCAVPAPFQGDPRPLMLSAIQNRLAKLARCAPARCIASFARRQDGAAAVEFGFVALPFFALLFAILETALVFFAGQSLEAAVSE